MDSPWLGYYPHWRRSKKKILHTYLYGRGIISVCIVPGWWITKKRRKQKRWKLILLGCRTGEGTSSALVEEKSSLYYRGGFLFRPEDYLSVVMVFWRFFVNWKFLSNLSDNLNASISKALPVFYLNYFISITIYEIANKIKIVYQTLSHTKFLIPHIILRDIVMRLIIQLSTAVQNDPCTR